MVMLHCILGKCLPIHHAWTSRRAHDKRKLNFYRMASEVTHLWTCYKTIFRIGIPTQRKWTNGKKMPILSKILQQKIHNIKLFKYYTKKDKTIFGQNCHHEGRNLPLRKLIIADASLKCCCSFCIKICCMYVMKFYARNEEMFNCERFVTRNTK